MASSFWIDLVLCSFRDNISLIRNHIFFFIGWCLEACTLILFWYSFAHLYTKRSHQNMNFFFCSFDGIEQAVFHFDTVLFFCSCFFSFRLDCDIVLWRVLIVFFFVNEKFSNGKIWVDHTHIHTACASAAYICVSSRQNRWKMESTTIKTTNNETINYNFTFDG